MSPSQGALPPRISGTLIQLKRPILPLPELLPALLEAEIRSSPASPVAMPVFFVLRGRKLTRFELSTVPPDHRDSLARELGQGSDGVAMLGGIAGQPDSWAIKVESARITCTVLILLREGEVLSRRV